MSVKLGHNDFSSFCWALNNVHYASFSLSPVPLCFSDIMEVVYANLLKRMSAIFNRAGQGAHAATCARSQRLRPACYSVGKAHSPSRASSLGWAGTGVLWLCLLDVFLYTPSSFLASRPDPWPSSHSILSCCPQHHPWPAVCLGIKAVGHTRMTVLSLFAHAYVI